MTGTASVETTSGARITALTFRRGPVDLDELGEFNAVAQRGVDRRRIARKPSAVT